MKTFKEYINEKILAKDFKNKIGVLELIKINNKEYKYFYEDIEYVEPGDGDYGKDKDYNIGLSLECDFSIKNGIITLKPYIRDLRTIVYEKITKKYLNKKYIDIKSFEEDILKIEKEFNKIK